MKAYRLHNRRYPGNSGEGARLYGGRWNPKGVPAIYCAETRSLAVLEVFVQRRGLPKDLCFTEVEFHETSMRVGFSPGLPLELDLSESRSFGQRWHDANDSAVLAVPSAIEWHELNFIINPDHPDFHLIQFGSPEIYEPDDRLRI